MFLNSKWIDGVLHETETCGRRRGSMYYLLRLYLKPAIRKLILSRGDANFCKIYQINIEPTGRSFGLSSAFM